MSSVTTLKKMLKWCGMTERECLLLGDFLDHSKTLLDDRDALRVTHNFLILDDSLLVERAIKVVDTVEVIKAVKGGNIRIVVE